MNSLTPRKRPTADRPLSTPELMPGLTPRKWRAVRCWLARYRGSLQANSHDDADNLRLMLEGNISVSYLAQADHKKLNCAIAPCLNLKALFL